MKESFSMADVDRQLMAVFDKLMDEMLADCKSRYDIPAESLKRIREMAYYTVTGGKVYRGTLVIATVLILGKQKNLDLKLLIQQAIVVAWCVEIMQGSFLVADDIMDKSVTRRGKLCWYKMPDVGEALAINDAVMLESMVYYFLRKQFTSMPSLYISLCDLFHEVSFVTELGQMLDLQGESAKNKEDSLKTFTAHRYQQIVVNKTAMYTFYLPIAAGMLLCGLDNKKKFQTCRNICLELGAKYQVQDDYLDVFGDPEKIGKKGTDIASHKCSWLAVTGVPLMSSEQKEIMKTYYGKDDEKSEKTIKALFIALNLPDLFKKHEQETYNKILCLISESDYVLPKQLFLPILQKIHGREK